MRTKITDYLGEFISPSIMNSTDNKDSMWDGVEYTLSLARKRLDFIAASADFTDNFGKALLDELKRMESRISKKSLEITADAKLSGPERKKRKHLLDIQLSSICDTITFLSCMGGEKDDRLDSALNEESQVKQSVSGDMSPKYTSSTTNLSVMNAAEAAKYSGISFNRIKDANWRNENNFPYHQLAKGYKTTYVASEIDEWKQINT